MTNIVRKCDVRKCDVRKCAASFGNDWHNQNLYMPSAVRDMASPYYGGYIFLLHFSEIFVFFLISENRITILINCTSRVYEFLV